MNRDEKPQRGRRAAARMWFASAASGALVLVGWSAAEVFRPPASPEPSDNYLYARAQLGAVEGSIPLRVSARWEPAGVSTNQAVGTVTSVDFDPTSPITPGTVLYTVDLRPVFAALGTTPSFRSLTRGMSGQDVAQLQRFLLDAGHFDAMPDGEFGVGTERAVRRWQLAAGQAEDGVVQPGDLLYFAQLPARITLVEDAFGLGKRVNGGEPALQALESSPTFSASITAAQASMIPEGTSVVVEAAEGEWHGRINARKSNEDGGVSLSVVGPDDVPLCGEHCDLIATTSPTHLTAKAITVPKARGVRIPSVAISTTASGDSVVIDRRGKRSRISVIATSRGQSIVTGIEAGTEVRVEPNR